MLKIKEYDQKLKDTTISKDERKSLMNKKSALENRVSKKNEVFHLNQ